MLLIGAHDQLDELARVDVRVPRGFDVLDDFLGDVRGDAFGGLGDGGEVLDEASSVRFYELYMKSTWGLDGFAHLSAHSLLGPWALVVMCLNYQEIEVADDGA